MMNRLSAHDGSSVRGSDVCSDDDLTLSVCSGEVVRLTVVRGDDGQLGFSVRGGSEHGLGVFISRVQRNSAAGETELDFV